MSAGDEFYVKKQPRDQSTLECALVWRGLPSSIAPPIPPIRFAWTEAARPLIDRIRRVAAALGVPESKELPYADLRAALQTRVPGMVLLEGWILPREEKGPLFAAQGNPIEIKAAAHRSIAAWCQLSLRPWAERIGSDTRDVDLLETRASSGELLEQTTTLQLPMQGQVPDALRTGFHDFADILLAIASPELEGVELFPGSGPVHRVLDREYGGALTFETWPAPLPGGEDLFSMVATISVETRPSSRLPFLVVRASKRIWCSEFPAANQLFGRRRITVRVVKRGERVRAAGLSVRLDRGAPKIDVDALLYETQRASDQTIDDLPTLVKSRGRMPDLFVGVPFRYGYRPVPKIHAGVTLQDQVDLTKVIAERLARFGFEPSRLRVVERTPTRSAESKLQANLHNLITHHFGHVDEADVPVRVEELFGAPEKKTRGKPKPVKTVDLVPLRAENCELLDRAFGKVTPINLMFVCRREAEESIFRSVVELMFGDRVTVVRHAMPEGVHGTRKVLDNDARLTRAQRAAARRAAWMPFAEQVRLEFPDSPVIVQAAKRYDGVEEDTVNKDVGRNTLATVAGCNVQYLLPPEDGKAAEYMHRVQAALYDLLFGHAGLGPVPANLIAGTFDEKSCPKTIVGISVVSQAPSRTGRPQGAELALAMKVDVETGRIAGRIGRLKNGLMDRGVFHSLSRTLVDVASAGRTSIGDKRPDRRRNFVAFVRNVVDEVASDDPNAVVLVDSTTARTLWSWLSDENISSDIYLEDQTARPPSSWKGLRFVRVREKSAGRLAIEARRVWLPATMEGAARAGETFEERYATAVERLVESLPEGNARTRHYLTSHGFNVRNQGARGPSSYRTKPGFRGAGASAPKGKLEYSNKVLSRRGVLDVWHAPSRIPIPLEITVVPSQLGDDEDRVAGLVAALRNGYSHTVDGTFLPAPLSFRSKILDYMDRYASGPTDDDPDDGSVSEDELEASDDNESTERPIGYGETRRWFEGASDFNDEDIPIEDEPPDQSPFAYPPPEQNLRTEQNKPSALRSEPRATAGNELSTMATMAPEQSHAEPEASEDRATAALVDLLRSPSATLPEFVTEEFISNATHFVNSDIRHIHQDREWVRTVTGFPWPEEWPGIPDMPALYLQALRYPAFAIIFQHQFFPDDRRGLPKNNIQQKNRDFYAKLRRESSRDLPKRDLSVLRAMYASDHGGDKAAWFAETLGLPGQGAWRAPCAKASDGLEELEARNDEWGELGRYLRAVVGPFAKFGNERTIGEIIEEIVIPHALANSEQESGKVEVEAAVDIETAEEAVVGQEETEPVGRPSESLVEIEQHWRDECDRLVAIAAEAKTNGPVAQAVSAMRDLLDVLERLDARATEMKPARTSIVEFRESIRTLTARISKALNELLGEDLNAPLVLSRLLDLPASVTSSDFESASRLYEDAQSATVEAEGIPEQVVAIRARLPVKQANEQATTLHDKQEQLLRRALELLDDALVILETALPAAVASPQLVTVEVESSPERVSDAAIEPPKSETRDPIAELEQEAVLETDDDIAVVDEEFVPVIASSPKEFEPEIEAPAPDPLSGEIASRIDRLFELGEFGLAFHLSSAALSIMPQREGDFTPVEFRLASAGGRNVGLSAQDLGDLSEKRSEALSIAQALEGLDDDRSNARLSVLLVGALPAALFRSDDPAAVLLVERIGRQPGCAYYAKLVSAVDDNRKLGFPLSPANLMAVRAHGRKADFIDESVAAIKETVSTFRSTRFRFQASERLKQALLRPEGLLGSIDARLTSDDNAIAIETNGLLRGREKIIGYIGVLAKDTEGADEIDAASRDQIFAVLSRIAQQCHDLTQAVDGFAALSRSASRIEDVKRLRDLVLSGISDVEDHFRASSPGRLTAAASRHVDDVFTIMRGVLQGVGVGDVPPLAVGLHSPLLWLEGLMWTGGWQPSPYNPEKILQEALAVPVPLVGEDAVSSFRAAFEARRSESAFVPAYMLLNIAHWFGVGQEQTDPWKAVLDTDKEVKKHQVKTWLQEAERTIDRMRRMAIGSLDQSARLKETLSTVNPDNLPVELPSTFLPETLTGDRIEDFNSAIVRIREVEAEAKREFDKSTSGYLAQIEELERNETTDPGIVTELRHLLDRREFTTLADRLNMISEGRVWKPLLPSGAINARLADFKAALPQLGTVDLLQVARAIELGKSFGPLDYATLDPEYRQQATAIARAFTKLKPQKNAGGSQIVQGVSEVVSQLLFEVVRCDEDAVLTRPRQQIYVFDAKVSMPPADPASLLLPEFGSLTQGSWRICVVTSGIPSQALLDLADGAGHRGVLVLYRGVLNEERRAALRIDLVKRRRAMIVVDEALLAFAIADSSDRRRSIIDVAQAYSSADPYKDHGKSAVPPEMFKGRSWERGAITDLFGSYVVFGGRRLGKTALLQQIHATEPTNAIFAYADIDMVNDASDAFEVFSKTIGLGVFKNPARSGEEFSNAIVAWLEADDRRRMLLLIDEADRFIMQEASTNFVCVQTLLKLMADTKNRFKFVLAGLHNVSRMVRVDNSPLVQISNYPLKIGPLINRDVDDAEFLVRGPLAAMGFEFDKREDVWRILTFTNYYPVLIQVFCKELLSLIYDQAQKTSQLPATIGTSLVERALSSSDVRKKLYQTFYTTIGDIEGRYELLTYILAVRELRERESGMAAEGMTAAEVAERAMEYWPACFQRGTDPNEIEYLLDEMEGFGISRKTVAGTFALRSRSLLELMAATEADLERLLARYKTLKAPAKAFDPKNMRRIISRQQSPGSSARISPLTDGQEADLLAPLQIADANAQGDAGFSGVGVVFGTELAGIRYVEAALLDARRAKNKTMDVEVKVYGSKKDMLEEIKRPSKNQRIPKVIVVSAKTAWRPDWVVEAERAGRVRKGDVRIIFVGDPSHAEEWSKDRTVLHRVLPQIKIVKLRPWTRSYLGSRLESLHLSGEFVESILKATGGWSEIAGPLVARISEDPARAAALIESEKTNVLASPDLLGQVGIPKELVGFFRDLAAYSDGSTVTTTDFQSLCTFDDRKISPRVVGIYSDLLGIINFQPDQSGQANRKVDLNQLTQAALLAVG